MHRSIIVANLLSIALLGACIDEPDDEDRYPDTLGESVAAIRVRHSCEAAGNPPMVFDRWGSGRIVPTKWCDNARVTGQLGAVLFAGTNWAVCQKFVGQDGWFVWTQGDTGWGAGNGWDTFPAVRFSGGESGGPIGGLPNCSVYGG